MIPRVFHQIWLGSEPFPAEYSRRQATWLAHHPGWELQFWTEENMPLPEELRRPEAGELLRSPWERADVLRLEVLWRVGGVYVDADLECLRSIASLIEGASFLIGGANGRRVDTALIGAAAGHPILDRALEQIQPLEFGGYDKSATGSRFLGELLIDEPDVTYVSPALLNPSRKKAVERAYAVGDSALGSESLKHLWQGLLKSKKRLLEAQKQASHWRAKYEQTVTSDQIRHAESVRPSTPRISLKRRDSPKQSGRQPEIPIQVPRILHQVWLGPNQLPEEYAFYQQSWIEHHPDWEFRFWTEDNLPQPLRRPESRDRLRVPAERADILRLEVVWRFGGVYVDADLQCLQSVEPLLGDAEFFTALTGSDVASNYFFGAKAAHPILERGLERIRPRRKYGFQKTHTGPRFLDELIADHRDEILLLKPATLKQYVTHHAARTYMDLATLRSDLFKARLEMLAASQADPSQEIEPASTSVGQLHRDEPESWEPQPNSAERALIEITLLLDDLSTGEIDPGRCLRKIGKILRRIDLPPQRP